MQQAQYTKQSEHGNHQVRLALAALVFGLASFYLITMSGHTYSNDEECLYYVTEGLVEGRGFTVAFQPFGTRGQDGQFYSPFPPGQSIAAIPLYLVGKLAALAAPAELHPFITRLYVNTFNIWITTLLCLLTAQTALLFGARLRTTIGLALLLGLTTMHWVYARTFLADPLTTLLTLLSFYAIARYAKGARAHWLVISGLAAGAALAVKPHAALVWPALGIYLLLTLGWPEQRWQWPDRRWWMARYRQLTTGLVFWLVGWLPPIALHMLYNTIIFGHPFTIGYSTIGYSLDPHGIVKIFQTPFYVGLYGMTLSSGEGIIFYAPIVVAGIVALREFGRSFRWAMWAILVALLIPLLFFSCYRYWYAGGTWGPRYMLLVLPLLALPLATWLETQSTDLRQRQVTVALLGLAGLLVQLIGLWTNFDTPHVAADETRLFFVPSSSPIVLQMQIAQERWLLWRDVLFPSAGTATLEAGYSYEGVERQPPPAITPLKALSLVVFSVRPQGIGDISFYLTTDAEAAVQMRWDGQPVVDISRRMEGENMQHIVARIPAAGAGHHELHLLIDKPGAQPGASLTLVTDMQFQEGEQTLQLFQRPHIPPMPQAPLRRYRWFHVPNIPHLCDNWLWYFYVADISKQQLVVLVLPLLMLALVLFCGSLFCLWQLRTHARAPVQSEATSRP
jgi:4-amino-4-deoxy-L-arabinose transferase-like glycosyltransferase